MEVDMNAYLSYSQIFEDLYQIYDGPKKSKVVGRHLGWVLAILVYTLSLNSNLNSKVF